MATRSACLALRGMGTFGALGHGDREYKYVPTKIDDKRYLSIACGGNQSFAIDLEGNTWSWRYASRTWLRRGQNQYGQLCNSDRNDRFAPDKANHRFRQIACGVNHSVGIDEYGNTLVWGLNCWGQLGIGNDSERQYKGQISQKFKFVYAGGNQSFGIDEDNTLRAWD